MSLVPGRGRRRDVQQRYDPPRNMAQVLSRKDSTMNISDSICPDCGGLLEVRRQGASQGMFCTLCSWALLTTCLPDFLNDATSYRVTVISGDVDNSAHVQAVASLTGLALPQARALLRAPAGWRSQAWHTRSRRCRRRLPGPDWSSGSSRHFRGDPRRPMRAIPARGRCRAQAWAGVISSKRSLIRSSKVRTRALAECRWPYTASSCKGAGRNSSGTSTSRPAARSSWQGPAARIA